MASTGWQRVRFGFLLRCAAQGLFVRDAVMQLMMPWTYDARCRRAAAEFWDARSEALTVRSGTRELEAQRMTPASEPWAWVLLCHGIGERLCFWTRVQAMLADAGVGSMVFHYSGYGRSRGRVTPEGLEEDARAAYAEVDICAAGRPVFVFGTSLGTAVAVQVACSVEPKPAGIVLAQGFTSLREAAGAVLGTAGMRWTRLDRWMPDVWRNVETLSALEMPMLVAHANGDELFPVEMGERLYAAAEGREGGVQAFVKPAGFAHGDVCLRPEVGYWGPVVKFMKELAG